MEKKYKILQIGPEDWRDTLALPAQLDWYHVPPNTQSAIQKIMDENDLDHFHAVILTDGAYLVDLLPFASSLEPYTVFYPEQFVSQDKNIQNLIKQHCMQAMDLSDQQGFVRDL
ncbi:MAG: accessory Sec system protein Asp2, partial [Streptococcus sp.]|nr:accessory Sec system protein Asp2 [Streptococcus sp.]